MRVDSLKFIRDSVLNSYGQIFFSNTAGFSVLLFLASFADPFAGICGLLSLLITIFFAQGFGLHSAFTRSGAYGYNSLMVGFVIGIFYQINLALLVIIFFASILTLFITVWFSAAMSKYKLPYLSIPFILSVWILLLSARSFEALHLNERGVYTINEMWNYGGLSWFSFIQNINSIELPFYLHQYFKSMGAILFQYNLVSGILVAIGMLLYSRIAFSLSLIGFYFGYLFCYFVQGNLPELEYSYIGFNFILTAIALGGFYLIPSTKSYVLVLLTMPLVCLLISASNRLMQGFQLPVYSLPFSIIVLLGISVLRQRSSFGKLALTEFQEFNPERNLYAHHSRKERFKNGTELPIALPFFGTWRVSQGHAGELTHKEDWQHAWDFDVTDENGKTFKLPGTSATDFYCYGLPVLAPAAGQVVTMLDGVEDNAVGDVNLSQNWGNSMVIKHADFLYSKLSHIKSGSFKFQVGDQVKQGDVVGVVGNSGRSPEPHLHFQLQAAPHIGAKTISFPISSFISVREGKFKFHGFEIPEEGQSVSKPVITPLLRDAFRFTPGMKMNINVLTSGKTGRLQWEVFVDAWNQSYIYCHTTGSCAWFTNNETLHYFIDYKGPRGSVLHHFYLAAHKVLLGYYPNLVIEDTFPLNNFYSGAVKVIQDFLAPFLIYLKAAYRLSYEEVNAQDRPSAMRLDSSASAMRRNRQLRRIDYELLLRNNSLFTFKITEGSLCTTAEFCE